MKRSKIVLDRLLSLLLSCMILLGVVPLGNVIAQSSNELAYTVAVVDYWGNPVVDAQVYAYPNGDETVHNWTKTTDGEGKAYFTEVVELYNSGIISAQSLNVTVTKNGYASKEEAFTGETIFDGSQVGTVTMNKSLAGTVSTNSQPIVYDGKAHSAVVSSSVSGFSVVYLYNNTENTTAPSYTDVGTYQVGYVLSAEGYEDYKGYTYVKIESAEITDVAITGTTNSYDGSEFPLVQIEGLKTEDVVTYTVAGDETVYQEIPCAVAVGNYTVTVTVKRGNNYKELTKTVTSSVKLGKLDLGGILVQGLESVYTGQPQEVVTVTGQGDYELEYKFADGQWSKTIPTVIHAGSYTVMVQATKTNYENESVNVTAAPSAVFPFNVYVAKAEQTGLAFATQPSEPLVYKKTYTNKAEGGQSSGKITYSVIEGQEYVTVNGDGTVTAIKAGGTAKIQATHIGDADYNDASVAYTISTAKAEQTDFAFQKSAYSVQYGSKRYMVTASGGQSGGVVTYEADGTVGTIASADNRGNITFESGKKGVMKIKATLDGGENYHDISAEATIEVKPNDFSGKYTVEGTKGQAEWYTDTVYIKPADGYLIATSDQFDAAWKDEIVIATEGVNQPDAIYLKQDVTDYIGEAIMLADIGIDKTNPTELRMSYSNSVRDVILKSISFGFYNAKMTVVVMATDYVSKIDHFEYKIGNSAPVVIAKNDITFSGNANETAMASFDIAPNLSESKITLIAYDTAGRSSTITGEKTLVVDDVKPEISISYDNNKISEVYYFNQPRTATIQIKEENFFKNYLYDLMPGTSTPYLSIKVGKKAGSATEYTYTYEKPEFKNVGDVYQASIPFTEDGAYTFDVVFYDYSSNKNKEVDYGESNAPTAFVIDTVAPVLEVSSDDRAIASKNGKVYYDGDRTFTIKVTEENFDPTKFEFGEATCLDIEGEVITKANDAFANFIHQIKTKSNWTKNGNVYTITVKLTEDANYQFTLDYKDPAGNAATPMDFNFCLDDTAPYGDRTIYSNPAVTYTVSVGEALLDAITFGFYTANVDVVISASDDVSGIDHFTYSYTGEYAENPGKSNIVIPEDDISYSRKGGKRASAKFSISETFYGKVSFTATDRCENESETFVDEDYTIVIDNVAPGITVSYDNNDVENQKYYKNKRTATIRIRETISDEATGLFPEDIYKPNPNNPNNMASLIVTVGSRTNATEAYEETVVQPKFESVTYEGDSFFEAKIEFAENKEYILKINYTNAQGKEIKHEEPSFVIDTVDPIVDVDFTPTLSDSNQYKTDRTATITITEQNFDANGVDCLVSTELAQGDLPDYAKELKNNAKWHHNGDVHTATITFSTEAKYSFDIAYTDLAGNQAANYTPEEFTVDKTPPTSMDITIDGVSVVGDSSTFAYDKFYKSAVTIKLSAEGNVSGLKSMTYQMVDAISAYRADGVWYNYDAKGIVVNPNRKFVLYFRAEDYAGNVRIVRSTGIVVDNQKPVGELHAPQIDILPAAPNANGFYNGNVDVSLKVVDPKYSGSVASAAGYYSGLNKITYKIYANDIKETQTGTLFEIGGVANGAHYDADQLVDVWNGKIVVDSAKFNSNQVMVELTATDNAGNTRTSTTVAGEIKVDITAPNIDVTYDNDNADSKRYFKNNRTATIVITERNFEPGKVVTKLTNSDGSVPALSSWKKQSGTGNGDDAKWTATVEYKANGDYTFGIAYIDPADNKGVVDYGDSVAPTRFTVDKIRPTVSVTYDNNAALNKNYYKAARVATIVITEHNLDPNGADRQRVGIEVTATDDGKRTTLPKVSSWKTNGDKHTATVTFAEDARYTFDLVIKDKAGNISADYKQQVFYVDTTAPTIKISGVANQSANKGDVIPVVSYTDTNCDVKQASITLNGANRKAVALDGSYTKIHNGRRFVFNNFPTEQNVDDYYTLQATLTDKAGNSATQAVTFSVNRFGSTYAMSETAESVNGTYVQKPVDMVITETNVDQLSNIKVTVFKDNETIVLKEKDDYAVDVKGGNGKWYQYTYTVFADNFKNDGAYRLMFHSEDAAGNIAENTLDTKGLELNFGVDVTQPNVVVTNLDSGVTYASQTKAVNMSVSDNLLLQSITVYLDDYSKAYKTWTGDEISAIVANGDEFIFDIVGDSKEAHKLKIVSVDAAGNELVEEITDFYVTTDILVRYYNNKVLFFTSIAGVILLAGLAVFLVVYKRRKKGSK